MLEQLRVSIPRGWVRKGLLLGVRAAERLVFVFVFVFRGRHLAVIALEWNNSVRQEP
ncbi:hypothetical protein [Streptomyces sp. ODS05-4]|uniref:hypothetical protein n=1 Tax=Streptomyces sp. ODS05-4 TaxID=2944939 RepID=UPI00210EBD13|nr:hypothetical protein [Streptomyces sp. ODS05-4]